MERRGSILVNRNLWGWWGWSDPFHVKAWVDLLLMAAWSEHTRDFQGEPVHLEGGQIVTSQRILANRWNVSHKRVRTFLRKVEKAEAIRTHQGAHGATLITICNYETYQSFSGEQGHTKGHKGGTRRAQTGHRRGTQKEPSNSKNTNKASSVQLPPGVDNAYREACELFDADADAGWLLELMADHARVDFAYELKAFRDYWQQPKAGRKRKNLKNAIRNWMRRVKPDEMAGGGTDIDPRTPEPLIDSSYYRCRLCTFQGTYQDVDDHLLENHSIEAVAS